MIRRTSGNEFFLITQVDHAALSGFLAGHVGNDRFTRPLPEMIAAAGAHDGGWPLHDGEPMLNARGEPLHVFEIPAPLATQIWSASTERATTFGPYAALLVSLHGLALSVLATETLQQKPDGGSARDRFELNKFQHRQIERQEELRRQLGLRTDLPLRLGLASPGRDEAEDRLRFDSRLVTLCDRLSLELCCGKPLFSEVEEILPAPGAEPVSIGLRLVDERCLAVEPWPFDVATLTYGVPCRRVSAAPFANETAFRAAYSAAAREVLALEFRRADA